MSFAGILGGRYAGSLGGHRVPKSFYAFRFDTGLPAPVRFIAQNGVVELLQRLDGANGGYLACLETTPTIIRGGGDEDGMSDVQDQVAGRTPCVLVGIGDQDFTPAGDVHQTKGVIQIPVYVAITSMKSRLDRLFGDAQAAASPHADPGIFVILEHVRELLHGHKPGSRGFTLKELRIKTERQLWAGDEIVIWEQLYEVAASYTGNDHRDISLELKQLETYSRLVPKSTGTPAVAETSTTVKP